MYVVQLIITQAGEHEVAGLNLNHPTPLFFPFFLTTIEGQQKCLQYIYKKVIGMKSLETRNSTNFVHTVVELSRHLK